MQEFRFGGEVTQRPLSDATAEQWAGYFYFRPNGAGGATGVVEPSLRLPPLVLRPARHHHQRSPRDLLAKRPTAGRG